MQLMLVLCPLLYQRLRSKTLGNWLLGYVEYFYPFHIAASMSTKTIRKEFSFETDILWDDFYSRWCANLDLDPKTAELGYQISGQEGPRTLPSAISSAEEFIIVMTHITDVVS